jgi:hypothetical protein
MKKLCAAWAAVFLFCLAAPVFAVDVNGVLVDLSCYKRDKSNTGVDHKMPQGDTKDCAVACAKKGQPVGLLTDKGEMYIVGGALAENNNARLSRHMGYKVAVQGSLGIDKDGNKTVLAGAIKRISPQQ